MAYKRVVLTERDNSIKSTVTESNFANTNSVKKQFEKFDNSYTSKKLNELYNEFDSITFNTPSISASTIVQENVAVDLAQKVGYKTKLYLSGAVVVTLLLAFLAIFNIFVINNLNGGIKFLQEDIAVAQQGYNSVYQEYQRLKDLNNITDGVTNNGFTELSSNAVINVTPLETQNVTQLVYDSNWFDAFCNFIGGLFGG